MQNYRENDDLVKEKERRAIIEKNELRGDVRTSYYHLGNGYDAQRSYLEKSTAT